MPTPFTSIINLIADGEPVDASTVNRPLSELANRTVSLSEKVETAMLGSALFDWEQPIDATAEVGYAVYRDTDGVYKPALAATEMSSDNATLVLSKSGFAVGVVQYKHSNVNGNILFTGRVDLTAEQVQAITITGTVQTGQMYLSSDPYNPGKITNQSPPIGIPVGVISGPNASGKYTFIVAPSVHDMFNDHIHYHVRLEETWDTTSQPDWPAGAVARYPIESDTGLVDVWPPVPIGGVHYDLDGIAQDLIDNPRVLIDSDGIWWMDSVNAPEDYTTHDFYFLRMTFQNDNSTVTSLQALDGSVVLKNMKTNTVISGVARGPVGIRANFQASSASNEPGSQALKTVGDGNVFKYGPVLAGIKSNTPGLVFSGDTHPDDADARYGMVTASLSIAANSPSGVIEFTSLDNVPLIEDPDGVHFYSLRSSVAGSIRGRLHVPSELPAGDYDLTLSFLVLARAAGTMVDLPITYRKLSASGTPASLPLSDTPLGNLPLAAIGAVTTNQYVLVPAPVIESVNPGDLVIFNISRSSPDSYPGDIGVLDQRWQVAP